MLYPLFFCLPTKSKPTEPPAPRRFTTEIGCLRTFSAAFADNLPAISAAPPALKVIVFSIGLFGYAEARTVLNINIENIFKIFFNCLMLSPFFKFN